MCASAFRNCVGGVRNFTYANTRVDINLNTESMLYTDACVHECACARVQANVIENGICYACESVRRDPSAISCARNLNIKSIHRIVHEYTNVWS